MEPTGDDQRAVNRSERQRDAWRDEQHRQYAELGRNLRRCGYSDERAADETEQRWNAKPTPRPQHDLVSPASVHVEPEIGTSRCVLRITLTPEGVKEDMKDGKIEVWLEGESEPLTIGVMIFRKT